MYKMSGRVVRVALHEFSSDGDWVRVQQNAFWVAVRDAVFPQNKRDQTLFPTISPCSFVQVYERHKFFLIRSRYLGLLLFTSQTLCRLLTQSHCQELLIRFSFSKTASRASNRSRITDEKKWINSKPWKMKYENAKMTRDI